MKYLISVCAVLLIAISGANLANAAVGNDSWARQGADEAVQNNLAVEAYFSGSGFESQVESYAQGNAPGAHRSSITGYSFFDEPNGHDYSTEEYLFFTGSGFMS